MKTLVLAALLLFTVATSALGEIINTDCFACKKQRDLTKVASYISSDDINGLSDYMKEKIYRSECTVLPRWDNVVVLKQSGPCVKVRTVEGDFWVWKWAVSPR